MGGVAVSGMVVNKQKIKNYTYWTSRVFQHRDSKTFRSSVYSREIEQMQREERKGQSGENEREVKSRCMVSRWTKGFVF